MSGSDNFHKVNDRARALREEMMQRVMESSINKTGDGFTSHDVARLIRRTSAYSAGLLKEMFDRKMLSRSVGKTSKGTHYVYREYQHRSLMQTDFRVDPAVHAEVERLMRGW
jgi:hypothetical protein